MRDPLEPADSPQEADCHSINMDYAMGAQWFERLCREYGFIASPALEPAVYRTIGRWTISISRYGTQLSVSLETPGWQLRTTRFVIEVGDVYTTVKRFLHHIALRPGDSPIQAAVWVLRGRYTALHIFEHMSLGEVTGSRLEGDNLIVESTLHDIDQLSGITIPDIEADMSSDDNDFGNDLCNGDGLTPDRVVITAHVADIHDIHTIKEIVQPGEKYAIVSGIKYEPDETPDMSSDDID
jgi:hypothetical protein